MPGVTAVLPVSLIAERTPEGGFVVSSITTYLALYHVGRIDEDPTDPHRCWVYLRDSDAPLWVALEAEILSKRVNDYWNGIA